MGASCGSFGSKLAGSLLLVPLVLMPLVRVTPSIVASCPSDWPSLSVLWTAPPRVMADVRKLSMIVPVIDRLTGEAMSTDRVSKQ